MKTAISIPDSVFEEADLVARRLGMSRSELYTKAVKAYLAAKRTEGVTEALDRVCSKLDSSLDPVLARAQFASLPPERW